jgi:hypothetical protein
MSDEIQIDPRLRQDSNPNTYPQQHSNIQPTNASQSPSGPPQYHQLQDGAQHNYYLPHTPQSAGHRENDGGSADPGGADDAKRPRACEACRGLKVRCEPNPNDVDGPCKRCAKANRPCIITAPSRKRQKKADSRVAELEKKIDALTATLAQKASGEGGEQAATVPEVQRHGPYQQVTNGEYPPFISRQDLQGQEVWAGYPRPPVYDNSKSSAPPMVVAGQKRKYTESRGSVSASQTPTSATGIRGDSNAASSTMDGHINTGILDARGFLVDAGLKPAQTHAYADVVDLGLLTAEMATRLFDFYVEKMAPHMPAVVFPPRTAAAEIRKTKPILFLSILNASSGSSYPELQKTLNKEVMKVYADRIIVNGEKTLELVQALQVSTLWYWPPEHFEELKFYQLIHIAAVMAIDIGMGKKNKTSPLKVKPAGLWRDHPWRRTPYPDPESLEARRAWLACYFLCCNASMGLRRPNLIRWSPYMADCVGVLENSPDAYLSDKSLTQWVRSQHIAEDVGIQFSMDDPVANVSIADPKVQYALNGFEIELERWSKQVPVEVQTRESTI